MYQVKSQWQTEELATTFLTDVRGAIPGADLQLQVIMKIVELWRPNTSKILDIGCGDGILGRMLLERFPEAKVTFIDFSEPMLSAVRDKVAGVRGATVLKADFSTPSWSNAVADSSPFEVIVSGFAIHHQPDYRKKALYAEIHEHLAPEGIFLNLEHVSSATPACERVFDDTFVDHLLRFHQGVNPGTTRQEVEAAFYHRPDKKENILAPVDAQCAWLREIGFEDVDCFFKLFGLALFGGRKAASNAS